MDRKCKSIITHNAIVWNANLRIDKTKIMIDKIKKILQTNETEINQSEFTNWGVLEDKYDDVAEQIVNLFFIHDVSCCDTCGKELTNIGGSQMYCHTCGTTKTGCN